MDAKAPALDFDTWCGLSASLNGLTPEQRDDLLDAKRIEPEAWESDDLYWLTELANDLRRDDMTRAKAYGVLCARELERRKEAGAQRVPATSVPIMPEQAALAPPIDSPEPVGPGLVSARGEAPPGDLLALLDAASPPPRPTAPEEPQVAANNALAWSAPVPDGDATCDALPILGPPLPFGPPTSANGSDYSRFPEPTPSVLPAPPAPTGDETMAMPILTGFAPSLPFDAQSVPPLPDLTVEQFASLWAELESRPTRRAEILARYRCPPDAVARLYQTWTQRLAADPTLAASMRTALTRYEAWLRTQPQ